MIWSFRWATCFCNGRKSFSSIFQHMRNIIHQIDMSDLEILGERIPDDFEIY